MFNTHQKTIGAYARADARAFARTLKFVVLTIRESLENVQLNLEALEHGTTPQEEASILFGHKRDAWDYIETHAEDIHWQAEEINYHGDNIAQNLVALFATIPGIGPAKAGFCAQLIYGCGGCIDTHNIVRLGIDPNAIKSDRYKRAKGLQTRIKYLERYIALCDRAGGCAQLWDDWCTYVATKRGNGTTAYDISALHCRALGLPSI